MKELDYDDFSVGTAFQTNWVLTEQLAKEYMEAVGLVYEKEMNIPSSIFTIYKILYEALGGRFKQGTIHLKQKIEHYHEPHASMEFLVTMNIVDKYEKKNRKYLVYEMLFSQNEKIYCKSVSTQLMSLI